MKVFVLILYLAGGQVSMQEWNSIERCEAAGTQIRTKVFNENLERMRAGALNTPAAPTFECKEK